MAPIPKRNQRQLASEVVGTAGVDRSAGFVAGLASDILGREAEDQRRIDVANARAADKRQGFVSKTNANNGLVQFNREMNRLGKDSRNQQEYDSSVDELLRGFQDGFGEDAQAESQFTNDAVTVIKRRGDDFFVMNEGRKADEVVSNLDQTTEEMIDGVIDVFGENVTQVPPSFPEKMHFFEQQMLLIDKVGADAGEMLSPEEQKAYINESKITMVQEAVSALMENRPDQIDEFMAVVESKDLFKKEELDAIRQEALKRAKTQNEWAKLSLHRSQNAAATEISALITSDDKSVTDSQIRNKMFKNEISQEDGKRFLAYKKSEKRIGAQNNAERYASLSDEFTNINWEGMQEGQGLAELSLLRNHIMDDMTDGVLTQASGQRWLKTITPRFNEAIESTFKSMNNRKVSIDWASDLVSQVLTEDADIENAEFRLKDDLMRRIDAWEDKKNGRASLPDMRKILDLAQNELVHSVNPNRTVYALGEVIQIGDEFRRVVGFDKKGDPKLASDLSRAIELGSDDLLDLYAEKFGGAGTTKEDAMRQQGTSVIKELPAAVDALREESAEFAEELEEANE